MNFYDKRRHWFHLSSMLQKTGKFVLHPWGNNKSYNRDIENEPDNKRICVAPTIAHCLTALPQGSHGIHIYRTYYKVKAKKPYDVFDAEITKEGWLTRPTIFMYIGTIDFHSMELKLGNQFWPDDAACCCFSDVDGLDTSKDALKEWKDLIPKINRHTKVRTNEEDN